jgi:hypothetical protein
VVVKHFVRAWEAGIAVKSGARYGLHKRFSPLMVISQASLTLEMTAGKTIEPPRIRDVGNGRSFRTPDAGLAFDRWGLNMT